MNNDKKFGFLIISRRLPENVFHYNIIRLKYKETGLGWLNIKMSSSVNLKGNLKICLFIEFIEL